ncbi:MAG: DUF421 domain-containing protein [Sphingomonas sp.]
MVPLDAIFGSKNHIEWWQECARAALILIYGIALVRLAGRRIFGKWSALDIIVSVIVGSSLSRALTGNAPLWGTLAATALLVLLHWVLSKIVTRWSAASHVIEGKPIEMARDGSMIESRRRRHALSAADIDEALHQSSVEDVGATSKMILEPSGKISIFKK